MTKLDTLLSTGTLTVDSSYEAFDISSAANELDFTVGVRAPAGSSSYILEVLD